MLGMGMKGFVIAVGGFLLGLAVVIIGLSLCNTSAYEVFNDFHPVRDLTLAGACLNGLYQHPGLTLIAGTAVGIASGVVSKTLFQQQATRIATGFAGAGYCLFGFLVLLVVQAYQVPYMMSV